MCLRCAAAVSNVIFRSVNSISFLTFNLGSCNRCKNLSQTADFLIKFIVKTITIFIHAAYYIPGSGNQVTCERRKSYGMGEWPGLQ